MRLLLCLVLAFAACKKESKPAEPAKQPASSEPAKTDDVPAATPSAPTAPAAADQADPEKVVTFVFDAARSGKSDGLAALCDPAGGGDGDVKDICGAKAGDPKWDELVTYFAKGKVASPAKIDGDSASVEILFGPDGTKQETMNLRKIDGKWYLDGF